MGRKGRWFDAVQRILVTSEPDHDLEDKEGKNAKKSMEKSRIKKVVQFSKPDDPSDHPSSSAATVADQHHPFPPLSQPDQHQGEGIRDTRYTETRREQHNNHGGGSPAALGASIGAKAAAVAVQAAAAVARLTAATPRAPARSKEELAAVKIQTAYRGYMERRGHQVRGLARLKSLVDGVTVQRQTYETLYCMQTMMRIQTQIYSRRVKTEEDKKALKNQIHHVTQGLDKAKVGEGWDHSQQSKEQMEAILAMKQEAASRRQRALTYAFSHQWRNRNSSSARAAPPPMFMDPGNPNWGWSWTERWLAAARPWESQTAPLDSGRAPAKSGGGGGRGRVVISVQIPTTPAGRSFRPPSCPSPSTPTPTPRSPYVPGRTPAAAVSPRGSPLHRSAAGGGDLRRTTSLQSERPRSSQERPATASGGGSLHGGKEAATLRRTTSLRSGEISRRLSLGSAGAGAASPRHADAGDAPVTPSYMQTTKSVSAKQARIEPHERTPPPQASTPAAKSKRLSLAFTDKPSASSPSKAKAERARRHSQPPSPRW